jgi:hypothetical protein
MASKNVRKIYSKTSNELVKVDMADRDGQGRVIHETYATKAEAGGAKRYRHRISVRFNGSSGTESKEGFFSFDFVDESSNNYSSSALINNTTLLEFMLAHCTWKKMDVGTSWYYWTNVNGIAIAGSGNDRYISVFMQIGYYANDSSGTPPTLISYLNNYWYLRRVYVHQSYRGYEENYLDFLLLYDMSTNYIVMVDVVEEV